jgi:hypothetical protein
VGLHQLVAPVEVVLVALQSSPFVDSAGVQADCEPALILVFVLGSVFDVSPAVSGVLGRLNNSSFIEESLKLFKLGFELLIRQPARCDPVDHFFLLVDNEQEPKLLSLDWNNESFDVLELTQWAPVVGLAFKQVFKRSLEVCGPPSIVSCENNVS